MDSKQVVTPHLSPCLPAPSPPPLGLAGRSGRWEFFYITPSYLCTPPPLSPPPPTLGLAGQPGWWGFCYITLPYLCTRRPLSPPPPPLGLAGDQAGGDFSTTLHPTCAPVALSHHLPLSRGRWPANSWQGLSFNITPPRLLMLPTQTQPLNMCKKGGLAVHTHRPP